MSSETHCWPAIPARQSLAFLVHSDRGGCFLGLSAAIDPKKRALLAHLLWEAEKGGTPGTPGTSVEG